MAALSAGASEFSCQAVFDDGTALRVRNMVSDTITSASSRNRTSFSRIQSNN